MQKEEKRLLRRYIAEKKKNYPQEILSEYSSLLLNKLESIRLLHRQKPSCYIIPCPMKYRHTTLWRSGAGIKILFCL